MTSSPTRETVIGDAVFVNERSGFCSAVTVAASCTGASVVPDGLVPVTCASLATEPASRSARVTLRVAVQVRRPPGSRDAGVGASHASAESPASVSVIATPVSDTLPEFVATNVYVISSPTLL